MKTTIKITALAVVTVLVALSCAPELTTPTPRDYGEYNTQFKAEYNNSGSGISSSFSVNPWQLDFTDQTESSRELKVTLPTGSDILNEPKASIESKLKEFLKILNYTNPAYDATKYYQSSTPGGEITYTFVGRNDNVITIRLGAVPNTNFVVKLDASKYTRNGQPADINNDGKTKDAYDDLYEQVSVINGGVPNNGTWTDQVFTINISSPSFGGSAVQFNTAGTTQYVSVLNMLYGTSHPQIRTFLGEIKDKFKLQIYNSASDSWSDLTSATFDVFNSATNTPADANGKVPGNDNLYVKFEPTNKGFYRVVATGMDNLATKENFGTAPAKVTVNNSFYNKTVYSNPGFYYANNETFLNPGIFSFTADRIYHDADKKGVVIEIDIPASGTGSSAIYPSSTADELKKGVKLAYSKDSAPVRLSGGVKEFVEIGISEIKLAKRDSTDTQNNVLVITLDKAYQLSDAYPVYILLNDNFKYSNAGTPVFFGNFNGFLYKGSFLWGNYGRLWGNWSLPSIDTGNTLDVSSAFSIKNVDAWGGEKWFKFTGQYLQVAPDWVWDNPLDVAVFDGSGNVVGSENVWLDWDNTIYAPGAVTPGAAKGAVIDLGSSDTYYVLVKNNTGSGRIRIAITSTDSPIGYNN